MELHYCKAYVGAIISINKQTEINYTASYSCSSPKHHNSYHE
jgi:hypothetical protein